MTPPLPAHQRGTATGYSASGRLLLTVTAAAVTTPDAALAPILKATAPAGLIHGESLASYAAVVARRAGLEVARWDLTGQGREDSADAFSEDVIY